MATTEQYLDIHQPIYDGNQIKIERIDREKVNKEGVIIAYVPIQGEYFAFALYINVSSNDITGIITESRNSVFLKATSTTLTAKQIFEDLDIVGYTTHWHFEDNINDGAKLSYVVFEPNPEPDEFEDKILKLLLILKSHQEKLLGLSYAVTYYLHVVMDFHGRNQMLGSIILSEQCITLLNNLNLKIQFDITSWGNTFKS
ncbi:hypothetical protein [Mucilaginibacter pallidiroseus]|uniref:hypothetical protein n=1 Tax=Mucilaginibacter pallidiroseus TaxID=2599295 RepID=UPI0011B685DF|nr:hypothetical protein [Mucilaginibacter pallidiroseus]